MKKRKINWKKLDKKYGRFVHILLMFISLEFMIIGVSMYFIGFHNMDIGHNLKVLNENYNLNFGDINNKFEWDDSTTIYITGNNQMYKAFFITMFSTLIFGVLISKFVFEEQK